MKFLAIFLSVILIFAFSDCARTRRQSDGYEGILPNIQQNITNWYIKFFNPNSGRTIKTFGRNNFTKQKERQELNQEQSNNNRSICIMTFYQLTFFLQKI